MRTHAVGAVVGSLCLAATWAAPAQALPVDVSVSYEYSQPWQVVPPPEDCAAIGSGVQTVSYQFHRVVQVQAILHRPLDRHPEIVASLRTPDVLERSAQLSVTPPRSPDFPCPPMPAIDCPPKAFSNSGGGFQIDDARRQILIREGGHVLDQAREDLDTSGACPGPGFDFSGWANARLPIEWRGWKRLFRPGGQVTVTVDRQFGPAPDDGGPGWVIGSYSLDVSLSGHIGYTLSMRNVCHTVPAPRPLPPLLRGLVSHGRVCR